VQWVETTGRTIEDAKEAALDQLGIDERDAEFEVIEEPKTGLFGRPRGEARIRARVVPKAPRPKQERRPRRGGRGRPGEGGSGDRERKASVSPSTMPRATPPPKTLPPPVRVAATATAAAAAAIDPVPTAAGDPLPASRKATT
jgi:spoIIIJ-associated protein